MTTHHPDAEGAPVGRRLVLGMLGLGAAGIAAAPYLQRGLESFLGAASDKDPTGLTGLLPNGGGFRYYSVASSVPHKNEQNYRLTVDGLVDRPATYTLDELRKLPQTRVVRDVQCVTGWRVPDTAFEGVKLSLLLDAAGVRPEAKAIRFTCFDGTYSESLTLPQARRDDVLVVPADAGQAGQPLARRPGPALCRADVLLQVGEMALRDHRHLRVRPGYWEERGYDVDAWVGRSNGRSDTPTV